MQSLISAMRNHLSRMPVISFSLSVLALLLYFCSDVAPFLQYDRNAIANGEFWRIFTSHWTHWSFDHFLWCTITFVALGCICEGLSPKGYIMTLVISSAAIPVVLWMSGAGIEIYRGLSGLASAIFVFGALTMMFKAFKVKDWCHFFLSATAGMGYLAKILYEFVSGSTLFVNTHDLFSPVPIAHLTGGIVGLMVVFACLGKSHRTADKCVTGRSQLLKADRLPWVVLCDAGSLQFAPKSPIFPSVYAASALGIHSFFNTRVSGGIVPAAVDTGPPVLNTPFFYAHFHRSYLVWILLLRGTKFSYFWTTTI